MCEICGYKKYPEILVFHHREPSNKKDGVNRLMKTLKPIKVIQEEIDKCMILCANCHREVHLKGGKNEFRQYNNKAF